MSTPLPPLLTPQEVGDWLSLPSERVTRLARRGEIPCIELPGGELAFDPDDLARWLDARRGGEGARRD